MQQDFPSTGFSRRMVYEGGYEVTRAYLWPHLRTHATDEMEVIRPVRYAHDQRPGRIYDPYTSDSLIQDFADITSTDSSVLKFVNKYGLVFGETIFVSEHPVSTKSIGEFEFSEGDFKSRMIRYDADSLSKIRQEALLVRACLKIFTGLSSKYDDERIKRIQKTYSVSPKGRVSVSFPDGWKASSWVNKEPGGYSDHPEIEYSMRYVNKQITDGLERNDVKLQMITGRKTEKGRRIIRPALIPSNLAGVIWHQMADRLTGADSLRPCEFCGRWFRAKRRDQLTCGDACRKAKSRARR